MRNNLAIKETTVKGSSSSIFGFWQNPWICSLMVSFGGIWCSRCWSYNYTDKTYPTCTIKNCSHYFAKQTLGWSSDSCTWGCVELQDWIGSSSQTLLAVSQNCVNFWDWEFVQHWLDRSVTLTCVLWIRIQRLLRIGGQGSNGNSPHIFALCLKPTVEGEVLRQCYPSPSILQIFLEILSAITQ